jgi:diaminopropionate ammonia-lyase
MRSLVNRAVAPSDVPAQSPEARTFHRSLPGYRPTPLRPLPALAAELGLGAVSLKDESNRLGLPAFKVLGASWAIERALREQPAVHTLVAASAGNHGRAVAHVAAVRRLRCRIFLPERSAAARRQAIAGEGAEVVVVDGSYEDAVAEARTAGAADGCLEIADVGDSAPAHWVIDGYATLFAEAAEQGAHDLVLVPVGVGSLAAAAARWGATAGASVIGVEPVTAACLTASLAAGKPTEVATPGTTMAGLDCAEISTAAWPSLRDGLSGTITVDDAEVRDAMVELAGLGLAIGESGAAPLAALRAVVGESDCVLLRAAVGLGAATSVLLVATEGPTDPATYALAVT